MIAVEFGQFQVSYWQRHCVRSFAPARTLSRRFTSSQSMCTVKNFEQGSSERTKNGWEIQQVSNVLVLGKSICFGSDYSNNTSFLRIVDVTSCLHRILYLTLHDGKIFSPVSLISSGHWNLCDLAQRFIVKFSIPSWLWRHKAVPKIDLHCGLKETSCIGSETTRRLA